MERKTLKTTVLDKPDNFLESNLQPELLNVLKLNEPLACTNQLLTINCMPLLKTLLPLSGKVVPEEE